ncbi:MAG: tRNA dimethylallyltransferase [Tenericutes bacterium ADurb.BinA155]|jgi:tRNA dimethylallyltransferase|nr:MAG: tRNA dimethylallyltransferase [Tenericutes bacterium ADurb.BinA155]
MILVLTGCTGSGKSALAIALAKAIDGEIINADAFQVYQELNIATAKPSLAMRQEVPHHLFDFVPLDQNYDVATYQKDLRKCLAEVVGRGHTPIIAGGTGLYIRAGLYDYQFQDFPAVDLTPFEKLDDDALYAELQKRDPLEAAKLHPHNRVRVLRSLEICLGSGQAKTALLAEQSHQPLYEVCFFGLASERENLYPAVEKRVDEMFKAGLVEEDQRLIEKYGRTPHAFNAIGVKELYPYFDGQISLEEAKNQIKENTRHYIKRQETFFRHQFQITWINSVNDILNYLKRPQ